MIILLCWCSCDELATEAVLKSLQLYVGLCGEVGLSTPRDAIVIALCKASLPPQYALHVLTVSTDVKGLLLDFYCFFFCESLSGSFQCSDSLILLAGRQGGHSAWKKSCISHSQRWTWPDHYNCHTWQTFHFRRNSLHFYSAVPIMNECIPLFSLSFFFTDLGAFFGCKEAVVSRLECIELHLSAGLCLTCWGTSRCSRGSFSGLERGTPFLHLHPLDAFSILHQYCLLLDLRIPTFIFQTCVFMPHKLYLPLRLLSIRVITVCFTVVLVQWPSRQLEICL